MHINIKLLKAVPLLFAAAFALTACGNVSRNVAKDGQSAESVVWPKVTDTTPMHKGGTFPNRSNLMHVHAGLNKQQISDLIGFPHFSEGVWGVREWSYLVSHGIRADYVTAEGHGKSNPVTTDCRNGERSQLIACLAPDRRVEVLVTSLKSVRAAN